jgi:hypothetical protein
VEAAVAATESKSGGLKLAALTAAALALPGMSPKVRAEAVALAPEIDTAFSRYEESNGRMRADVYQAAGSVPLGDSASFRANGVKDVISGASPVANYLGPNGKPVQILSSASIRDVRDAVDLSANYAFDAATVGVNVGRSSENDYSSDFFNLDGRWDLNQKLTTLAAGFGFASDQVWAITHAGKGVNVRVPGVGGDKSTFQGLLGVTQVLDKNSLVQANLTYTHSGGYLSDPYKFVQTLFDPYVVTDGYLGFIRDSRPGSRDQFALLLRYVHDFNALNDAALHLDYRFYADTWGIDAHTFEAAWYQPIYAGWQLVPRVRYYSQGAADFYQPVFSAARADGHYSSDYRMASFGAVSGGAALSKEFLDRLRIAANVDFYERQKGFALAGGTGTSVDNFTYSIFSVSVDFKF